MLTEQERDAARYAYIRDFIYLGSHNCDADVIKLMSMQPQDFDREVDKQMQIAPKGRLAA